MQTHNLIEILLDKLPSLLLSLAWVAYAVLCTRFLRGSGRARLFTE